MSDNQSASANPRSPSRAAGLGLYIHIPYCRSKCGYCSFNSVPWVGQGPDAYLDALLAEMANVASGWGAGRVVSSIFIGGGTPTIYDGSALARLLAACRDQFSLIADPEITIETNPNTVTATNLAAYRAAGANRLSIGVQTFDDRLLTVIGRSHSVVQAVQAVTLARQAGFSNLNLDLIYGLPTQGIDQWRHSINSALDLTPDHLALYELSVEAGTLFAVWQSQGELSLPDDDCTADMADLGHEMMANHGYLRYEISNYARPGSECWHNLNYWQNGSYIGLGAGAVSSFAGLRLKNIDNPTEYMARIKAGLVAFQDGEALSLTASFRESVVMGLRMLAGVSLASLRQRYGLDPLVYYGESLAKLRACGLVAFNEEWMWLTAKALPVANQILAELV
jgi:oxygen-independent coproporphyrinogen-3 oxidase